MLTDKNIRLENGIVVSRYRIIGTSTVIYRAYEPTTVMGNHSSLTSFDEFPHEKGIFYGTLVSRRLPPEIAALPAYSVERSAAVREFYRQNEELSYRAIRMAFEYGAWLHGKPKDGEIIVTDPLPTLERDTRPQKTAAGGSEP